MTQIEAPRCDAPPKDLSCYSNNPGGPESCDHTPLCDTFSAHWYKVCNDGWTPEATNINDPVPSRVDMNAWELFGRLCKIAY